MSELKRGILWMLVSILLASMMDAISKYLSQSYPVFQIVWARYLFQALPVMVVLGPRLPVLVRTRRMGTQLLRSAMLLGATVTFIFGLKEIPLAEASTILFLAPLIVTALSLPLLREQVGARRWVAVLVGFAGAVIVIRPGAGIFQGGAFFPLATAFLYALYMITTRQLSRTDSALTTLVYTASVGALLMSAIVPFNWVQPDFEGWALMILLGALGGANHFALILAFRAAPAAVISPLEYSRLIWATSFGFVLFGDLPDVWAIAGAALIVVSGLYVYSRESGRVSEADIRASGRDRPVGIRKSTPADGARVMEVWRRAVDATHDFLTAGDRREIEKELVGFLPCAPLDLAVDENDRAIGFMLVDDGHMEALFVDPEFRGSGIGRALIEEALRRHPGLTTDVNEQNLQAIEFYRRMGFEPCGRSEMDGQGRPYPLIHLRRAQGE